jgi:hypothetical protein
MNIKRKTCWFALMLAGICLLTIPGCTPSLVPGGDYNPAFTNAAGAVTSAPDYALFASDKAFELAYVMLDSAFKMERENRVALWNLSPQIKKSMDELRVKAVRIKQEWATARKAYLSSPAPESLSTLQGVLAEIQRLSAAASTVITPTQTKI